MDEKLMRAIDEAARTLRAECEGLSDALQYAEQLADDTNDDFGLNYPKDSDSYGVLYKACESAIRKAHRN
jgi:hypothetical protein